MKTIKQLFPELTPAQRIALGNSLRDELDIKVDPKIKEEGNMVRVYHPESFDKMTEIAIKLFKTN